MSLSLGVGTIETLFAGAHRRLWGLLRPELADARREPTELTAPWAGGLLVF